MIKAKYKRQKYDEDRPIEIDIFMRPNSIHHLINISVDDAKTLILQISNIIRDKKL